MTPCFASSYKQLDGSTYSLSYYKPIAVVSLASGASISINNNNFFYHPVSYWTDSNGVKHIFADHGYLELDVDVNGAQGPNILGRDLFYMQLYSDGKVAESYNNSHQADYCLGNDIGYGVGCLTKIMQDGWKMDY